MCYWYFRMLSKMGYAIGIVYQGSNLEGMCRELFFFLTLKDRVFSIKCKKLLTSPITSFVLANYWQVSSYNIGCTWNSFSFHFQLYWLKTVNIVLDMLIKRLKLRLCLQCIWVYMLLFLKLNLRNVVLLYLSRFSIPTLLCFKIWFYHLFSFVGIFFPLLRSFQFSFF